MNNKIDGFKWHLPLAFKNSVAQCKFEQGDVIYPIKTQGKTWEEKIEEFEFLIQVKSPISSQSLAKPNLDVFNSNWDTSIIFEKIYPKSPELNHKIDTTQGAFYTYLWKNDESVFNKKDNIPPVTKIKLSKVINYDFVKSKIPLDWTGFALVVDYVNDISLSKRQLINDVLTQNFNVDVKKLIINDCVNLDKGQSNICPTLGLELYVIECTNIVKIEGHLKEVLFKGIKNKFNINTHGLLIKN